MPLLYEIRAFWEDAAVGNGTGREGSARYRLTRAPETWAANKADAVAVICEGLRRDLVARGVDPGKIMVSPNGVDMALFGAPLSRDAGFARSHGLEGAEVIGFSGLSMIMRGSTTSSPPCRFSRRGARRHSCCWSAGADGGAASCFAAASPAADRIRFTGRVPHDQVDPIMR